MWIGIKNNMSVRIDIYERHPQRHCEVYRLKKIFGNYEVISMLVIPEKFVDKCIENFEETDQRQILEEECAELIQAISKNIRGKPNSIDQIKEEMTHVLMSINVVARKLGISQSDILNEISKKCNKYGWDVDWNQK